MKRGPWRAACSCGVTFHGLTQKAVLDRLAAHMQAIHGETLRVTEFG
jgi:hypothetical protein